MPLGICGKKNEEAPSNTGALRCPVVPNKKNLRIPVTGVLFSCSGYKNQPSQFVIVNQ